MSCTPEGFLLSHVVNQGDIAATQALLSEASTLGIDVNDSLNPAGETPLFVAIRRCLPAMIELLLRFGANPQIATDARCGKQTPLHLATELDQCATITMLLTFGADPNTLDAQKQTALHVAARMGHVSSARVLIAHGTNLLAEDGYGRTALRLAETSAKCSLAHAEIAKVLLAAITDAHGKQFVDENNLKVDETANAAAGGPIAFLMSGQVVKSSGVPLLPASQFLQEARQIDAANIAWVNSSTISSIGKKKK